MEKIKDKYNPYLNISSSKDKTLFTPGPLITSRTVKNALMRDLGSRDFEFIEIVQYIREFLLELVHTKKGIYETIIVQGNGTYGLEAVVSSTVPRGGKLLVIINGAYGHRINTIAKYKSIETVTLEYEENKQPSLDEVDLLLHNDKNITNVAVVHCETTSGIINPVKEIGEIVKKHNRIYFVDAVTTLGAYEIDINENYIDYLVASSNKCLEGVPGFSIIIARKEALIKTETYSRSLSFDLYSQWKGFETDGQFRFAPPTHSILAFKQALHELEAEGGVVGRAARYKSNYETLIKGMRKLGFREYLFPNVRGYIITSFLHVEDKNYSFSEFYRLLNEKDMVIYPGKLSTWDGFRIGTIGRIFPKDVKYLLSAIEDSLLEMGVEPKNRLIKN